MTRILTKLTPKGKLYIVLFLLTVTLVVPIMSFMTLRNTWADDPVPDPSAGAGTTTSTKFHIYDVPHAMLNVMQGGVIKTFSDILTGGGSDTQESAGATGNDASGFGIFESIGSSIKDLIIGDKINEQEFFKNVYKAMWLAAIVIMVMASAGKIFEAVQMTNADTTTEVLKGFYKIGFSGLIMTLMPKIIDGLVKLASQINDAVSASAEEASGQTADALMIALCGKTTPGFLGSIGLIVLLIIPFGLTLLLILDAVKLAISIWLEIGIRKMLIPLAMGDIYLEGIHSTGFRALKRLFGSVIKISVAMAVMQLANAIITAVLQNPEFNGIETVIMFFMAEIAVNMTALGITKRSGEFINDALG